ncbi:hypothetical protein GC163_13210 [bacterium]|nr:hypothetical protein [bacterium]
MKLNRKAAAYRKLLERDYPSSPLVDVVADTLARYEECKTIVEADGLLPNGKPHPLLTQLRSLAQTVTSAIKVMPQPKETPQSESTLTKLLNRKPRGTKHPDN